MYSEENLRRILVWNKFTEVFSTFVDKSKELEVQRFGYQTNSEVKLISSRISWKINLNIH